MDKMGNNMSQKYLNTISFSKFDKWYVSFYLNPFTLKSKYKLEKLSLIIAPTKDRISKNEYDGTIQVISKISFSDGKIHLRDENKTGMDLYVLNKKQLLVSKINFHQGAVAVNNIDKLVCSTHYQPYLIDKNKINSDFLILALRSKPFLNFIKYLRADGIKNEATYEFIGELEIPLPSISEQNRIVDTYNKKIQLSEDEAFKAEKLEKGIETYLSKELGIERGKRRNRNNGLQTITYKEINRWALSYLFKDQRFSMENAKYPIIPLKSLITFFEGGKTPSTSRKDFWGGNIYWTSAKDMKELFLENVQDKITEKGVIEGKMKVYPVGTILGVFRSGILRHSFPVTLTKIETTINQDLKAIGVDETMVIKEYFLFFLKTLQKFILERAQKFGVTVESINTDEFLEIPVVLPPLDIQEAICNSIKAMLTKINELRSKSILTKQSAIKKFENEIFKPCN